VRLWLSSSALAAADIVPRKIPASVLLRQLQDQKMQQQAKAAANGAPHLFHELLNVAKALMTFDGGTLLASLLYVRQALQPRNLSRQSSRRVLCR